MEKKVEKILKIIDEIKEDVEIMDRIPRKEWRHKKGKILRLLDEIVEILTEEE